MLLEKPMAVTLDDCIQITNACRLQKQQINAVCHVLRYFPPCIKIKEIIDSGVIGDIVNINHTEPVGFEHFAHSFVRGNWHNEAESSFSLLAKCCHDIDLIVYWMGDKKNVKKSHLLAVCCISEKKMLLQIQQIDVLIVQLSRTVAIPPKKFI